MKMSIEIDELVQDHEKRIKAMEVSSARLDERLDNLVKSTANLKWSIWSITFLLLLAVIYGAIGKEGFNQVTKSSPTIQQVQCK